MLKFSTPLTFHDLSHVSAGELITSVKNHCNRGEGMHQDSLKSVVLKLTTLSRNLQLKQDERDEAASLATGLANAALKAYGSTSDYGRGLMADIQAIMSRAAA